MAKVKIQGHASGTGILTVTAPNTSTDRTITLPDATGELLSVAGGTMTGDLILGDNVKLEVGSASGGDLQIYHDASNSYIKDAGTGGVKVLTDVFVVMNGAEDENMIHCDDDGAVTLYNNGNSKLATSASGVTVTGTLAATAVTGDGSALTGIASSSRYFHARGGSNQTLSDSTNTHLTLMTSEVHQSHSSWSTDTFTAVAADAGHWMFILQLSLYNSGNDIENPMAKIYLNDAQVRSSYSHVYSSNIRHYTVHNTSVITIANGDTIKPYGYAEAPATLYAFGGDSAGYGQCSFIGYKLN